MPGITIAVLQMDCREGDREHNRRAVMAAAAEAKTRGAAILALPELWSSGYDLEWATDTSEFQGAEDFELLGDLARKHQIGILGGSLLESDGGSFRNCAVAFTPDGDECSRYRKLHLFRPLDEHRYLQPGEDPPTCFDLGDVRFAQVICYDLRFPEVFRALALEGAEIIHVPAQWPRARIAHWRALLVARAIECQCTVVGVNRSGRFRQVEFPGHSLVVGPRGEILLEGGEDPGLLLVNVDGAAAREWRQEFPALEDRREDLYPPRRGSGAADQAPGIKDSESGG